MANEKVVKEIEIHFSDGTYKSLEKDCLIYAPKDEVFWVEFEPQDFARVAGFFLTLLIKVAAVLEDVLEHTVLEE